MTDSIRLDYESNLRIFEVRRFDGSPKGGVPNKNLTQWVLFLSGDLHDQEGQELRGEE